ncbi:dethiobiotin synthase [Synechococcus sp. HK01-R]|jgi:dethiobiotin synthetase|uniref:dethiobiotin synthase n=1 Tax=Synechococcus sp. HK01-R TaxID=2751171 RepID=UPI001626473A|nr:dethiobiotin synthase [Synechococcus sp. HK01-R]NDD44405.1 dethiobiotin synthase [Synechococcaceae bacterium WB9_4xB_025]QNG27297.1 dethiobiotin synthase [Synechococcus sp. HK01-R]
MTERPCPGPRLVVCGTDTDVGKTVVSALLVQGLEARYWKPVQSGLEQGGDRDWLVNLLHLPPERWLPEAYAFQAPVSPHWAAEMENQEIDPERLSPPNQDQCPLVIETAGGLHVPLTRTWRQIDQLERWQLPVLLVARSGLGTLNHSLLSLEALNRRSIPVLGLILNGPIHPDNPRTLEELAGVPVLAQLPPLAPLNAQALAEQWRIQGLGPKFERILNEQDCPQ